MVLPVDAWGAVHSDLLGIAMRPRLEALVRIAGNAELQRQVASVAAVHFAP